MKLHMNETDMAIDFRDAKDKKEMLQILIDQNPGCDKEFILDILEKHGCRVGWYRASKADNMHKPKKEKPQGKFNDITEDYEEKKEQEEVFYEDLPFEYPKAPEIPDCVKCSVLERADVLKMLIEQAKETLNESQKELNQLESWAEYNGISLE